MQENGRDMHNAANGKIGSQSLSSHSRRFPTKADLFGAVERSELQPQSYHLIRILINLPKCMDTGKCVGSLSKGLEGGESVLSPSKALSLTVTGMLRVLPRAWTKFSWSTTLTLRSVLLRL